MICRNIYVENFRNIKSASVDFSEGVNVLLGENAQGKTNLLEAIYLTALGKSFRQGSDKDLIKFDEEYCFVRNSYRDSLRDIEISIRLFGDRRQKRIEQNGVRLSRTTEMVGGFKVVLFCPEHLSLIKEGPALRRNFLDVAISQLRPLYMKSLQRYQTILKERNALLRNASEGERTDNFEELLHLFSEQLAKEAACITVYRVEYLKELRKYVSDCFFGMTGGREKPEFSYVSSSHLPERECDVNNTVYACFMDLYDRRGDREIAAGTTLWGIHKDDIEISLDGNSARIFASQGQQRSLSLAMKLSEGEIIKKQCGGDYPVFLFDDVLSELDGKRREYLLSRMQKKQVIMTTCESNGITADCVIGVKNGIYTPM